MYSSLPLATLILLSTRLTAMLVGVRWRRLVEGEEEEGVGCVGVPETEGGRGGERRKGGRREEGGREEGGREGGRKEGWRRERGRREEGGREEGEEGGREEGTGKEDRKEEKNCHNYLL